MVGFCWWLLCCIHTMGQSQPPGQLALSSALTKAYQATDSPGTFLKPSHTEGDAVTTTGVLWSQARQPRENQPPHQSAGSRPSCSTLAPLLAIVHLARRLCPLLGSGAEVEDQDGGQDSWLSLAQPCLLGPKMKKRLIILTSTGESLRKEKLSNETQRSPRETTRLVAVVPGDRVSNIIPSDWPMWPSPGG